MVPPPPDPDAQVPNSAVSAHILLRELREVARALPTGLDEVSLGARMLSDVRGRAGFDRAVVYTYGDSDSPAPLTVMGSARVRWDLRKNHPLVQQVVTTRTLATADGSFSDSDTGSRAIFPLRLGDQLIGIIAMERNVGAWNSAELDIAQSTIDEAAVHLDSGRLFSEVRALATMEERRRLAREIHDGIAQEIASLGYVVDELVAEEQDEEQRQRIWALRGELTRIVSELRLSIFDLRSDVQPHTGLGAALSSYVRQVGASSGLTVHLVLDESTDRLSVETETELLRIAQEAITNARRHSRARNLWVTCRVSPPNAYMRVADDGRGLGSPRIDSYGLDIMRERAGRLGVDLSVRERRGGGTVIEIALGSGQVDSVQPADSNPSEEGAGPWRSRF